MPNPPTPDDPAMTGKSAALDFDDTSTSPPDSHRGSLVRTWYRLINRFHFGALAAYAGVASLIGVDALAAVLSAAAIWPVGITIAVVILALAYFSRARWRVLRRRHRSRG